LNQRTHRRLHLQSLPILLRNVQPRQPELWLTPTALVTFRKANANDSHCVSWIIRNITDRKAFDIAIRLASMIPWFEDGLDVEPLYNLIILLLEECFCYTGTGEVSPGWRDRAYQTAQAILWIHTCALCKSTEIAQRFPLPVIRCDVASLDPDFQHLFGEVYGEFPGSVITGYALNSSIRLTLSDNKTEAFSFLSSPRNNTFWTWLLSRIFELKHPSGTDTYSFF
jgi:hypothetical protein